jgi:hypothetical protein
MDFWIVHKTYQGKDHSVPLFCNLIHLCPISISSDRQALSDDGESVSSSYVIKLFLTWVLGYTILHWSIFLCFFTYCKRSFLRSHYYLLMQIGSSCLFNQRMFSHHFLCIINLQHIAHAHEELTDYPMKSTVVKFFMLLCAWNCSTCNNPTVEFSFVESCFWQIITSSHLGLSVDMLCSLRIRRWRFTSCRQIKPFFTGICLKSTDCLQMLAKVILQWIYHVRYLAFFCITLVIVGWNTFIVSTLFFNPKESRWGVTLLATRHAGTRVWC